MAISHCKLRKKTQLELLKYFVLEVTARSAANLLGIQPNSAALFYRKIRTVIFEYLDRESKELFNGQIELDESYFGGTRKGKRGRGAAGKVVVFGMLKRHGKVYTVIVHDTSASSLMYEIANKIKLQSVVYTDSYQSYNALDVSGFHHHRINHAEEFADKKNHINGIENFWNQAKRVLRKYNGIDRRSFPLFLKECEFRFNYGTPKEQLKTLRLWCDI
jgi:transposase